MSQRHRGRGGKGGKRAAPGDRANWSDATIIDNGRHLRSYLSSAGSADQDPARPDLTWLMNFLNAMRVQRGTAYTRRHARPISLYFKDHDAPDLVATREIKAILRASDDEDPLAFDFEDPALDIGRASPFTDEAFRSSTLQSYSAYAKRYRTRCLYDGVDPLRPPAKYVGRWLANAAKTSAYMTIRNMRNALSNLFVKNGVPNAARTADVDDVLEGLKRVKPPKPIQPYSPAERQRLVDALGSKGLGLRDRVLFIIAAYGRWTPDRIVWVDVEDCTSTSEGVSISAGAGAPPLVFGSHPDAELDLATWLPKLIELLGPRGPLFQASDLVTFSFTGERLSAQQLYTAIRKIAKRAELPSKQVARRLRLLFEYECRDIAPNVVLQHFGVVGSRSDRRAEADRAARLHLKSKKHSGKATL